MALRFAYYGQHATFCKAPRLTVATREDFGQLPLPRLGEGVDHTHSEECLTFICCSETHRSALLWGRIRQRWLVNSLQVTETSPSCLDRSQASFLQLCPRGSCVRYQLSDYRRAGDDNDYMSIHSLFGFSTRRSLALLSVLTVVVVTVLSAYLGDLARRGSLWVPHNSFDLDRVKHGHRRAAGGDKLSLTSIKASRWTRTTASWSRGALSWRNDTGVQPHLDRLLVPGQGVTQEEKLGSRIMDNVSVSGFSERASNMDLILSHTNFMAWV